MTDRQWKNKRVRNSMVHEINDLNKHIFSVKKITPYQYRINDQIDLYPTGRKFHNLKTGERGEIEKGQILPIVLRYIARKDSPND